MSTPSKQAKIDEITISDDDELDGDIRFEMYSPEDELEHMRVALEDRKAVTRRHDFGAADEPVGFLGGMQAFLARKKQETIENVTGFLGKLDEVEQRLKVSQDRLERQMEEEQRAQAAKEQIGYQMTEAIRKLNDNVDREGLSRSSGGRTATTRGSDSDLESSFSAKHEAKVEELRQMKQAYEEVAPAKNPRLYNSVVNQIGGMDDELEYSTTQTKARDPAVGASSKP